MDWTAPDQNPIGYQSGYVSSLNFAIVKMRTLIRLLENIGKWRHLPIFSNKWIPIEVMLEKKKTTTGCGKLSINSAP